MSKLSHDEMRAKFVKAARGYFGIPYKRTYHSDTQSGTVPCICGQDGCTHYDSPLFLDCCALVRRCVADMQDDFGFRLGRWNQSYQFDTLPKEVTLAEMKPGDLVFTSGIYHKPGKKQQKHNMVHVEIFVGGDTGEATIGARWQKKGVQLFDSYRFNSKSYKITGFHFRSIDTWLGGVCKSHCKEHKFVDDRVTYTGKYSMFKDDDAEAAESADGDGDGDGDGGDQGGVRAKTFFVGKGNGWRMVAAHLAKKGWTQLPFDHGWATTFALKWCERRGDIDYDRFVEGAQLANHVPNNTVITSKNGLIDTLRAFANAAPGAPGPRALERDPAAGVAACAALAFFPASYRLDLPSECLRFFQLHDAEPASLWIVKPTASNRGRGIRVLPLAALRDEILGGAQRERAGRPDAGGSILGDPGLGSSSNGVARSAIGQHLVAQRYVARPLLLRGRKFDVRVYALVATVAPGAMVAYFARFGYLRLSMEPYSLDDLGNRFVHLTNASVQKQHAGYKAANEAADGDDEADGGGRANIWSLAQLGAYLERAGAVPSGAAFVRGLRVRMKEAAATVLAAAAPKFDRKQGFFDLLGLDFLLDEARGLHLLEANTNPALSFDGKALLERELPRVVGATLDVVAEVHRRQRAAVAGGEEEPAGAGPDAVLRAAGAGAVFEPLFDEAAGWRFAEGDRSPALSALKRAVMAARPHDVRHFVLARLGRPAPTEGKGGDEEEASVLESMELCAGMRAESYEAAFVAPVFGALQAALDDRAGEEPADVAAFLGDALLEQQ